MFQLIEKGYMKKTEKLSNSYSQKYGYKIIAQKILLFFVRPYYQLFFKMEVEGEENIPKDKTVIFVSTHSSYHDPVVLSAAIKTKKIAFMAKSELFQIPVIAQLSRLVGAFPVNRKKIEVSTIKKAKYLLTKTDWCLGIFPQGTRIMDGTIGTIKGGFSLIAKATKSTAIPVLIDLKRGKFPFYGKIIVKIGKPLPETDDPNEMLNEWTKAVTEMRNF